MIYLITYCNKTGKIMNFPTFPYACRAFSYRQCSSTPSLGSVKRPPGSSAGDGTPSVLHAMGETTRTEDDTASLPPSVGNYQIV